METLSARVASVAALPVETLSARVASVAALSVQSLSARGARVAALSVDPLSARGASVAALSVCQLSARGASVAALPVGPLSARVASVAALSVQSLFARVASVSSVSVLQGRLCRCPDSKTTAYLRQCLGRHWKPSWEGIVLPSAAIRAGSRHQFQSRPALLSLTTAAPNLAGTIFSHSGHPSYYFPPQQLPLPMPCPRQL